MLVIGAACCELAVAAPIDQPDHQPPDPVAA